MNEAKRLIFPCHSKPRDQWCDRGGIAGFMGHTCVAPEPEALTRDELLILLIEECGEVIQAATKCLRFGFDADHGTGYGRNDIQLAKECGEMAACCDALKLDIEIAEKAFNDKIARATAAKAKYGRALNPPTESGQPQ